MSIGNKFVTNDTECIQVTPTQQKGEPNPPSKTDLAIQEIAEYFSPKEVAEYITDVFDFAVTTHFADNTEYRSKIMLLKQFLVELAGTFQTDEANFFRNKKTIISLEGLEIDQGSLWEIPTDPIENKTILTLVDADQYHTAVFKSEDFVNA